MAGLAASLPTGPRGRVLAALITLLAVAVLWLVVVSPLLDLYQSNADALVQRRALAGRMQDLADALPGLRQQVQASRPKDAPTASLLEGTSDAVAAATLQGLLETMCSGAGAKITSAEALPAEQAGAYRRIGLRVSLDADWSQLTRLLRAVEKATPRMFVDDLQLHAQPTSEKVRELPLDIALTLLAFRLPGAPPAPASTDAAPAGDAAAAPAADAPADLPDAAAAAPTGVPAGIPAGSAGTLPPLPPPATAATRTPPPPSMPPRAVRPPPPPGAPPPPAAAVAPPPAAPTQDQTTQDQTIQNQAADQPTDQAGDQPGQDQQAPDRPPPAGDQATSQPGPGPGPGPSLALPAPAPGQAALPDDPSLPLKPSR